MANRTLTMAVLVFVLAFAWIGSARSHATGGAVSGGSGDSRLLYASDWLGPSEVFAVDPSASVPVGQVTSGAPLPVVKTMGGYPSFAPSPDGRRALFVAQGDDGYVNAQVLYVGHADGRGRRRLATLLPYAYSAVPVWAPDSRRIAYVASDGVHVVNADGSGDRAVYNTPDNQDLELQWSPDSSALAVGDFLGQLVVIRGSVVRSVVTGGFLGGLAWSPSGAWIAFEAKPDPYKASTISIVSPNGNARRTLARPGSADESLSTPVWSPDGRFVAFLAYGAGANGVPENGVKTVDVRSGKVRVLDRDTGEVGGLAWSPDGHRLAFASAGTGIEVTDTSTGRLRLLSHDFADELAWSPDGRWLAYVVATDSLANALYSAGDLRVASPSGHVRTLVAASGAQGGVMSGITWTRPPRGTRYRRPTARSVAMVSADQLVAPWPVVALAADGDQVAYGSCTHAFVWRPTTGAVVQVDAVASLGCDARLYYWHVDTLAVAVDRVAYGVFCCQSSKQWWRGGSTLATAPRRFTLDDGNGSANGYLSQVAGSGQLLVFDSLGVDNSVLGRSVTTAAIRRVGPTGCPCPTIANVRANGANDLRLDADHGRILVAGGDQLLLLDANGRQLLTIPSDAGNAVLSGADIVASDTQTLFDYDSTSGARLHTWPLTASSGRYADLQDAAHGLAAYTIDGQVHLLRLADGKDATIGPGTLACFMDTGLVYADGARLHLVPFDQLPLQ